jgi:sugar lactone lactonase YvrE
MKHKLIWVPVFFVAIVGCSKHISTEDPLPDNPPTNRQWRVSTVAGTGEGAFANGPVLSAAFHLPADIAVDAGGDIYVTDIANFRIRRIAGGMVSTAAGGSGFNVVDGPGATAQFYFPFSIAFDENRNAYLTDDGDPRIRKINMLHQVSTYAGTPVAGFKDGRKDMAQFKPGAYVTSDGPGNLYLSDGVNNSIRKISLDGQVTTIASQFQFSFPGGIVINNNNNLFLANRGTFEILRITPDGRVSKFAGSGTPGFKDGGSSEAQFSMDMRDLVMDSRGNLFLADDNRIRMITPDGAVSTIAGSDAGFMDGDGTMARFNYPNGLAVDNLDNIYVADLNNNRVRKISLK